MAVNEEEFHHITEGAVREYLEHHRHPSNRETNPYTLD